MSGRMCVASAMTSADIALAGVDSVIPFDEVVITMYKVSKQLPEALKETSMGGLAATPTAIKIAERLRGNRIIDRVLRTFKVQFCLTVYLHFYLINIK